MKKNKKVKIKGSKEGCCNICWQSSQLTRDHIPPKACVKPTALELITLTQYLTKPSEKPVISQSGLCIPSICGNCNNNLLGTEYDPELISVSKQIASLLKGQQELGLLLPETIKLNVKPQRLIRAVIGHTLAGRSPTLEQPHASAPFPKALRDYFLDPSKNIADEIEVYYWVYPFNNQVVINGFSINSVIGEGNISGSCLLKFFPLAFWIVWDKPPSFPINTQKISSEKFKGLDESCEIVIDLRNFPSINYPEVPDSDNHFIIYHNESTVLAQPKKPKGFG
jgi:hypothetical protein